MSETTSSTIEQKIRRLHGPILVLGASGFIGANLLRTILKFRDDAFGTATRLPAWRLEDLPAKNVLVTDLLVESNVDALLQSVQPRTVFDCVAYGGYSFETDAPLIYRTNFTRLTGLLEKLAARNIACYVHAGSSSEYGDKAGGPRETDFTACNSVYSVSKAAAANLIYFYGKKRSLPCANLRLYSVYGPMEDASRLVPTLVDHALRGQFPPLVSPDTSRDFIYVDDVAEAFLDTAINLEAADFGESFNIGSGQKTTIGQVAQLAKEVFNLPGEPAYSSMPGRSWDVSDWYANIARAEERLRWNPRTDFRQGLAATVDWFKAIPDKSKYQQASKRFGLDTRHSVSAVVACYKDARAIPIMYDRLKATFAKLNVDFEIVFVNDCSPDDSEEVIRAITRDDRRVVGVSHSRNFGSQAAFVSGMSIAGKNACVLLDGDLQDPPELIEQMVAKWREGYDVVFGRRVKREASLFMQLAYKAFYRVFDAFSYVPIPRDAGDFSLMDRRVVDAILRFPERDLFLRGVRAFVGFKQTGVNYVRPERMFGRTTNNFIRNLGWAKRGILSFSNVPLQVLSLGGFLLLILSLALAAVQFTLRLMFPKVAPEGITTVLLLILFFGGLNVFAVSVVGEYIAKIFEEVKRRPLFVRRSVIRHGEIRPASEAAPRGAAPLDRE